MVRYSKSFIQMISVKAGSLKMQRVEPKAAIIICSFVGLERNHSAMDALIEDWIRHSPTNRVHNTSVPFSCEMT